MSEREQAIAAIVAAIRTRQRFVLSSHARPDGDAIGSQIAMALALESLGKNVTLVNRDPVPGPLTAFPGTEPGPYLGSPSSSALYAHVGEILATQRRVAPHKWRAITTGEGLAGVTVPDPATMRLPPMPNGIATAG